MIKDDKKTEFIERNSKLIELAKSIYNWSCDFHGIKPVASTGEVILHALWYAREELRAEFEILNTKWHELCEMPSD
jgi:hypothetical protein